MSSDEKLYGQEAVENAELEAFENRTQVRKYTIEFTCPEFTCLCPRSGFPDFATIHIRYVPDRKCVELKSLKLYINRFRDQKIFHEDVTNLILQDLVDLLEVLYEKLLEEGTFKIPAYDPATRSYPMTWSDLVVMVEGINEDVSKGRQRRLSNLKKHW